MAEVFDLVKELSATVGTGGITLGGAVIGHRAFADVCGASKQIPYCIRLDAEWEVGFGLFITPDQLDRTFVEASSNAGALVNFSAGDKEVYINFSAHHAQAFQSEYGTTPVLSNGGSVAAGPGSQATASGAVAIGGMAIAQGGASVAVGIATIAAGDGLGNGGVAIGNLAESAGGVSVGYNAKGGIGSVAIGAFLNGEVVANYSLAISGTANGNASIAIGRGASAAGDNSIAIGSGSSQAVGFDSITLGTARTEYDYGVAIGYSAWAGMIPYGHARGRRYGHIENTVWIEKSQAAGSTSAILTTDDLSEMVNTFSKFFVVEGYVAELGDEHALFKIRVAFHKDTASGVWSQVGTAVYELIYSTPGAVAWGVAVTLENIDSIIRVTVTHASTGYKIWTTKLIVEGI